MTSIEATHRTTVKRKPDRGSYDREVVNSILDEALICHVGFVYGSSPFVIPTIHARVDDTLYLHGSPGSRMLKALKGGLEVCVTVTLLDALVLARSALEHSMNYRSVVVLGESRHVSDPDEKMVAFEAIVEHVTPGRWADVRWPDDEESRKTEVVAVPLTEASAKVRTGPGTDLESDIALSHWAGLVPIETRAGTPIPAADLDPSIGVPEHISRWKSAGERLELR